MESLDDADTLPQLSTILAESVFENVDDPEDLSSCDVLIKELTEEFGSGWHESFSLVYEEMRAAFDAMVLKYRQDLGCAFTALEDISSHYEHENRLTVSLLKVPAIGTELIQNFEGEMFNFLLAEKEKWREAYADHLATELLPKVFQKTETVDDEPPSESDEESGEEGEDEDYESEHVSDDSEASETDMRKRKRDSGSDSE